MISAGKKITEYTFKEILTTKKSMSVITSCEGGDVFDKL